MKTTKINQRTVQLEKPQKTILYIKNMVGHCCKSVVQSVLERLELQYTDLEIGRVVITDKFSQKEHDALKAELLIFGLDLMEDEKDIIVERINNAIVEMVHFSNDRPKVKFSVYLCEKLNNEYSYAYLSTLFSEVKGYSIRQNIILHKVERAKEMIVYYNELTLSEIAWKLHYNSVAHLSYQFKKITGLTATHFKNTRHRRLTALEDM